MAFLGLPMPSPLFEFYWIFKVFYWFFCFNQLLFLWLVLGMAMKFNISLTNGSKLKVRKYWELIPTFGKIQGERLVSGGAFWLPFKPSRIALRAARHFDFCCYLLHLEIYHILHDRIIKNSISMSKNLRQNLKFKAIFI